MSLWSVSGGRSVCLAAAMILLGAAMGAVPAAAVADDGWSQATEVAQWQAAIRANGWDWEAGPTPVNAIPPEERSGYLGLIAIPEETLRANATGVLAPLPERDLPSSWDWRAHGGTTPTKDQGGCGSCWAFAAVGALESAYKIANGTEQLFSEQQCLACNDAGQGCGGGNSSTCYQLWTMVGAVSQTCMPYHGSDGWPCVEDECTMPARLQGYTYVANRNDDLKTAILTSPVAVGIYASGGFFSYHSGCYGGANGPANHMILLCGWDDNACGTGQGAWLIKNSWGPGWGQSGFGWIKYNTTGIGGQAALVNYIPFPAAHLAYASHQIPGGGALAAGQTSPVSITVTNFGYGTATGITGTLRCLSPGVTVVDSVASFPNLASWASGASISPYFSVQVGDMVPDGTQLQFQLVLHSDQAAADQTTFCDFVAPVSVVYQNDFESNVTGWSHGDTAGLDDWRWGTPRTFSGQMDPLYAASGSKVWGNDLDESNGDWDGLYPNGDSEYLQSPVINCAGHTGIYLQFKRWLTCERGYGDVARILVNGTEIWRNERANNVEDVAWMPIQFDIDSLAANNPSVLVRFELNTTGQNRMGGWNIDDFRVLATENSPAAVGLLPGAGRIGLAARPNPFSRLTAVRFTLASAERLGSRSLTRRAGSFERWHRESRTRASTRSTGAERIRPAARFRRGHTSAGRKPADRSPSPDS